MQIGYSLDVDSLSVTTVQRFFPPWLPWLLPVPPAAMFSGKPWWLSTFGGQPYVIIDSFTCHRSMIKIDKTDDLHHKNHHQVYHELTTIT